MDLITPTHLLEDRTSTYLIYDEIEALSGILCTDGEFEVQSAGEKEVVLMIQPQRVRDCVVSLVVVLDPSTYPLTSPKLSVQCPKLNRAEINNVNLLIEETAAKLRGEAMILSLVDWLVEHILELSAQSSSLTSKTVSELTEIEERCTIVAQLDHIRSRTTYAKTLSQWFRELDLHGILVFYKKLIFLLVSGSRPGVQAYLRRHRTQNIDIDSSGRPCKERLLSVLGQMEESLDTTVLLDQVELKDSIQDWTTYWQSKLILANIYQKFIQPLQTGQKK